MFDVKGKDSSVNKVIVNFSRGVRENPGIDMAVTIVYRKPDTGKVAYVESRSFENALVFNEERVVDINPKFKRNEFINYVVLGNMLINQDQLRKLVPIINTDVFKNTENPTLKNLSNVEVF